MENLIRGLFRGVEPASLNSLLRQFLEESSEETFFGILLLAPLEPGIWELADTLDKQKQLQYWREVEIRQIIRDPVQLNEALERLIEAECPLKAASLVYYRFDKIETGRIFRLLKSVAERKNGSEEGRRLDPVLIEKALEQLDKRAETPRHKIADLEADLIGFLRYSTRGVPCTEDRINRSPEFFAEIVSTAYNLQKDPSTPDHILKKNVWRALDLLDSLKRLPGRDESGELNPKIWLSGFAARRQCSGVPTQLPTGDYCIGELLSKSLDGKDGIWPCEPVRDALEKAYSEKISSGFRIGRSNSHDGTHVGFGGDPERKTERRYREWAERIKYSHPRHREYCESLRITLRPWQVIRMSRRKSCFGGCLSDVGRTPAGASNGKTAFQQPAQVSLHDGLAKQRRSTEIFIRDFQHPKIRTWKRYERKREEIARRRVDWQA